MSHNAPLPVVVLAPSPTLHTPPQVLPVNDTCVYGTWWDSYPYSSLSVHALHPQYLALRACLDDLPEGALPPTLAVEVEAARVRRQWRPYVCGCVMYVCYFLCELCGVGARVLVAHLHTPCD